MIVVKGVIARTKIMSVILKIAIQDLQKAKTVIVIVSNNQSATNHNENTITTTMITVVMIVVVKNGLRKSDSKIKMNRQYYKQQKWQ